MASGLSILLLVAIILFGGLILGSIGGSIGATFRDILSVINKEKTDK
jgi:Sec-independent protein translocase protein TatA